MCVVYGHWCVSKHALPQCISYRSFAGLSRGKFVFEQCWGITAQLILVHFGQVIFALSCCHKSLEEKLGINMNDFVSNIDAIAVAEGA